MKSQIKGPIDEYAKQVDKIKDNLDEKVIEVFGEIKDQISNISSNFKTKIKEKVTSLSSAMQEKIAQELASAEEKTIEATRNKISEIFKNNSTSESRPAKSKGKGVGIQLNYREYLKIFMLLRYLNDSGSESVLNRISTLIESNIKHQDNQFSFESYGSVFELETGININTLIIGNNSVFSKENNFFNHFYNGSEKLGKKYNFKIKSILGY